MHYFIDNNLIPLRVDKICKIILLMLTNFEQVSVQF